MAKLVLKFANQVLREVPLAAAPITIGRSPDNDIHIDNLAVSNHHARIYTDAGTLQLEDLESLNGTFLNNSRVKRESLRSGDIVMIGKHTIEVDQAHDVAIFDKAVKISAPKVEETVVFRGKRDAAPGNSDADRAQVPNLVVLGGKTSEPVYALASKLVVIGKSPMATVRLRGWFAPQVAAQISKTEGAYYLTGMCRRILRVNGEPVRNKVKLNEGDTIEVAGVSMKFAYAQ